MRKLAAIFAVGAAATVLVATGGAAAQAPSCVGQNPYLPNGDAVTAAAAVNAASAASGLGRISASGTFRLTFTSSVCGGFRLVLRAREIRPGKRGYPTHDGFTTLENLLTTIKAGPVSVTIRLTARGRALLNYARAHGQALTVFVISHVRPAGVTTSSEALQIVTIR